MSEQRPKTEIPAKIDALKADLDKVARKDCASAANPPEINPGGAGDSKRKISNANKS